MPAGTITDPTLIGTHSIEGTVSAVTTALGTWLGGVIANTVIHSITTVRSENSQGVSMIILYELP